MRCCRRSTWTTSRPRRYCSRPATSPSWRKRTSAERRCTGWATRPGGAPSLNETLLAYLVRDGSRQTEHRIRLYRLLRANDFEGMRTLFHAFFASIPHEWYTNNDIARYEGFYASVFYSYFAALGLDITVEDSTSHGRLDMAVRFNANVYPSSSRWWRWPAKGRPWRS